MNKKTQTIPGFMNLIFACLSTIDAHRCIIKEVGNEWFPTSFIFKE